MFEVDIILAGMVVILLTTLVCQQILLGSTIKSLTDKLMSRDFPEYVNNVKKLREKREDSHKNELVKI